MVDEPVNGGDGLGFGGEEGLPVIEAGICGEEDGAFTMPDGDEPEEVLCGVGIERNGKRR